jgi:pyruvate carboxylase
MSHTPPFKRLLVANRGEIAIRILRAATELGIRTIALYTHEDRFSQFRFKADESYKIGIEGQPIASYLDAKNIVATAKKYNVDAIHPGYGFLSESAEFAELCRENGIKFIGPEPEVLKAFGDKVTARRVAEEAGLPVIPGTKDPVPDLATATKQAEKIGYPITLKAVSGGGGKGIRMIHSEAELEQAFERAQSEAMSNFGRADIYLEKMVVSPKHIEVQILGDEHGNVVHLYERDCSIQRRHQKVVEVAPALGIPQSVREELAQHALKIAKHLKYTSLGTVEFLVSATHEIYFLEVNPRIQVEHTVTEMITGIDLVQASILVAAGVPLSDSRIGIASQDSIVARGAAIQCRVTTEDPQNNFAPDTGEIIAYRPACGFGIRLDEGQATSGGTVTPHYDSLLVKVTAWANDFEAAAAKMHRSLSEFRVRGIKHNIPLLRNVVKHEKFLDMSMSTSFFTEHPEVFEFQIPRDRATKILRYIADVTVNNPHDLPGTTPRGEKDSPHIHLPIERLKGYEAAVSPPTAKEVFDKEGVAGLQRWIKNQHGLLLTDTTMRDAHQSLFATRLRTRDMLRAAPLYREYGHRFFSLEVWGGATFDTCLRFLKEDPWKRLEYIREKIPNVLLQMLLRGDNAVGYTNYPEWVVRDFIKQTVASGLDVFRIFDCLNQPEKMALAIDEVKKQGAIAEVCICYTGNIVDPSENKYTLGYYLKIAKQLTEMGADILCIKDMAGLLRPKAAQVLVKALKENLDIPIHLHMHDTSGAGVTTLLEAAKAGCEIVDGAVSSMSGLTSQPSMNALVAAMGGDPRCPEVALPVLDVFARYWESVRSMYQDFDPGIRATSTDVYEHEIPGGQYSNLYEQARKVGVTAQEFFELTQRYKEVNELLGNIVKVTPSSKVVGDMALLLQKHGLTGPEYMKTRPRLDYPDSVVSFCKGHMGTPYGGFNEDVRTLVLGDNPPPPGPPDVPDSDSFASVTTELAAKIGREPTTTDVLSYRLYPKVFLEFIKHREKFGSVTGLPTPVFFYGAVQDAELSTRIEDGKTLIIELAGLSESNVEGERTVFFKLNGFPRAIDIIDNAASAGVVRRAKADSANDKHVGAAMPGKVLDVQCKVGDSVAVGQVLLVTESMKMEYAIAAKSAGTVREITVRPGDMVEGGDLLVEFE